MSNKHRIALNIVTVVIFNVAFWLCNYYPRHIIEIDASFSVVANVFNLLYFALYFFVLNIIFGRSKSLFSENIFNKFEPAIKRFGVGKIAILLVLQGAFDASVMLLNNTLGQWSIVATEIFTLVNWTIVYAVLANKKAEILKNKKLLIVMAAVLGAVLGVSIMLDISTVFDCRYLMLKYEPTSEYLLQSTMNIEFLQGVRALFFDCVIGAVFVIFHTLSNRTERTEKDESYFISLKSIFSFVIRVGALLIAMYIVLFVKMWIYPVSCVKVISSPSSQSFHYADDKTFHTSSFGSSLSRIGIVDGKLEEVVCCERETEEIYNDNKKITTFELNTTAPVYVFNDKDDTPKGAYGMVSYVVEGNKVQLYRDLAICIIDNEKPRVVRFEGLDRYKKNELVIESCKHLLSKGNIFVFEYCADYLLKYDSEFIKPYIDRYANGDFNAREKKLIKKNGYRSSFFVDMANKVKS